jgi:hypothetical protein
LYVYQTRIGPFFIAYSQGRFRVVHDSESIGSFATAEEAAHHIARHRGFAVPGGIDTAILRIPASLARWESCLPAAAGAA